jgi:TonB family protein
MLTIKTAENTAPHWLVIPLLLLAALTAGAARAGDLRSAEQAYAKGDYEAAFKGFHELAEIGQPTAQFNLAVMYANGQGTRQSEIYAYAWASLSAENGVEKARAMAEGLRPQLALAPGSDQIAKDIEAQYGNAVLDQRLFPKLASETTEMASAQTQARCHPVHAYMSAYPESARRRGIQGGAYAEFSVMPDGRVRNPHIVFSLPERVFDAAVRQSLLRSEYQPAAPGSGPALCMIYYRFEMSYSKDQYVGLQQVVSQTLTKAQNGDPGAQMLYGMLLVGLPQLHRQQREANPWFLRSAQAGTPIAQFQIGFNLLHGWGCDCEENKGLDWLRRAAQSGEPNAEITLAMYALRGSPDESRLHQAWQWLEQAAAGNGNYDAQLYLAALLAAAPSAEVRDPHRALVLVNQVREDVAGDPAAFEVRAAAEASAGKYTEAVRSEKTAIEIAQNLHWDLTPLNARLASYAANQPWYGVLLAF